MSIAQEFEMLVTDKDLAEKLAAVQDLKQFQDQYTRMIADGLIQKKEYNLAPVNVLGVAIPGQTTYRVSIR
ncbi:MAG: hypothetical protein ACYCWB_13625 [Thiobacillus sp.]